MNVCWQQYHSGEELMEILCRDLARASMDKMIVGEKMKVEIGSEK
jgi:hypothetical protein